MKQSRRPDLINHPSHYKGNGIETIDVIEGFDLDFKLGNAVKYILRCGKKAGPGGQVSDAIAARIDDLSKARWYIDRQLSQYKKNHKDWLALEARIARENRKYETRGRKR